MRISYMFLKSKTLAFAVFFGLTSFAVQPLVLSSQAHAEGHYGAVLAGKGYKAKAPSAKNFGGAIHRSGVRFGKVKRHHRKAGSNYRFKKRKREIARRNVRVQQGNDLRRLRASIRRSGPNGRFLTRQERVSILNGNSVVDPDIVSEVQGGIGINTGVCPTGHDCGYRIYSDGTGPRIITPGVRLGNDLPSYDGLNGSKIITLD